MVNPVRSFFSVVLQSAAYQKKEKAGSEYQVNLFVQIRTNSLYIPFSKISRFQAQDKYSQSNDQSTVALHEQIVIQPRTLLYLFFLFIEKQFSDEELFKLRAQERSMMERYVYLDELREADTQDERVKSILFRYSNEHLGSLPKGGQGGHSLI